MTNTPHYLRGSQAWTLAPLWAAGRLGLATATVWPRLPHLHRGLTHSPEGCLQGGTPSVWMPTWPISGEPGLGESGSQADLWEWPLGLGHQAGPGGGPLASVPSCSPAGVTSDWITLHVAVAQPTALERATATPSTNRLLRP